MQTIIRDALDAGYQITMEKTDKGILVQLTGRNVYEGLAATPDTVVETVFELRARSDDAGDAPDTP